MKTLLLVFRFIIVLLANIYSLNAAICFDEGDTEVKRDRRELKKDLIVKEESADKVVVRGHRLLQDEVDPLKPANILSIDGGGVRGIIAARFLEILEEKTGQRTADLFDLMAGTSTGGILALGLSKPNRDRPASSKYTASEMVSFYQNFGKDVFSSRGFRGPVVNITEKTVGRGAARVVDGIGSVVEWLPSFVYRSDYSPAPLEEKLETFLGGTYLKYARIPTVVTSFDNKERKLYLFKSYKARQDDRYGFRMKDVARATSAAPTYFPQASIKNVARIAYEDKIKKKIKVTPMADWDGNFNFVDGGVSANNPSRIALDEARWLFGYERPIRLISIGTGYSHANQRGPCPENFYLARAGVTIDQFCDGSSSATAHSLEIERDANPNFNLYRLQVLLGEELIPMDRPENVHALKDQVDRVIQNNNHYIEELARVLTGDTSAEEARKLSLKWKNWKE